MSSLTCHVWAAHSCRSGTASKTRRRNRSSRILTCGRSPRCCLGLTIGSAYVVVISQVRPPPQSKSSNTRDQSWCTSTLTLRKRLTPRSSANPAASYVRRQSRRTSSRSRRLCRISSASRAAKLPWHLTRGNTRSSIKDSTSSS